MPLIQIPRSVAPCQVDIPDTVKLRSRKGSIHLKPGVCRVTVDEWEHIKKSRPDVARKVHVVPFDEAKSIGAIKKAEEKRRADAARPKPLLAKRAKDSMTKRERKLAGVEKPQPVVQKLTKKLAPDVDDTPKKHVK